MALVYVGGASATGAKAPYDVQLDALTGGIGTAAQAGDLVIVATGFIGAGDNQGVDTPGYTLVWMGRADDARDASLAVAYKLLTTAEVSVTCRGSPVDTNAAVSVVHVWRGADSTTPLDVPGEGALGIDSKAINGPAITPVSPGAVVVTAGLATGTSPMALTAPTGYGNLVQATADPGNACVAGIASKEWSGSGVEDPDEFTGQGTTTNDSWTAATLAIRPATASSGGTNYDRAATAAGASAVSAGAYVSRFRAAAVASVSSVSALAQVTRGRGAASISASTVGAGRQAITRGRSASVSASSSATANHTTSSTVTASAAIASASGVTAAPSVNRGRSASIAASSAVSASYTTGSTRTASAAVASTSTTTGAFSISRGRAAAVSAASTVAANATTSGGTFTAAAVQSASTVSAQAVRIIRRDGSTASASNVTAARQVIALRPANVETASAVIATAAVGVIIKRHAYPGEMRGGRISTITRGGTIANTARSGTIQRG